MRNSKQHITNTFIMQGFIDSVDYFVLLARLSCFRSVVLPFFVFASSFRASASILQHSNKNNLPCFKFAFIKWQAVTSPLTDTNSHNSRVRATQ